MFPPKKILRCTLDLQNSAHNTGLAVLYKSHLWSQRRSQSPQNHMDPQTKVWHNRNGDGRKMPLMQWKSFTILSRNFFNVLIMSLAKVGKMSPGIIPGISGWLIFTILALLFFFLRGEDFFKILCLWFRVLQVRMI